MSVLLWVQLVLSVCAVEGAMNAPSLTRSLTPMGQNSTCEMEDR